jgi:Domain of unknown function (DUF1906)
MDWLKANTNLSWCGYYLAPAPSHTSTSWMGRRPTLVGKGWGVAGIFVGQQVTGPGSLQPSASTGLADGNNAAQLMKSEGFPSGSFVYLDLENGPPLTVAQEDYLCNWCDTVVENGYGAGIYCSHGLAFKIHLLRSTCRIWAFNVATTLAHPVPCPFPDPSPSGCGYIGAHVWQLGQNCLATVPPANLRTLDIDLSSAIVSDPSAP